MKIFVLSIAVFCAAPVLVRAQDSIAAIAQTPAQMGFATTSLTLTRPQPITAYFVPLTTSGIGTNRLVTYNWNPKTQLKAFYAAQAAGNAVIVAEGDSTTGGFGSTSGDGWDQASVSAELVQGLNRFGIPAQGDNFVGHKVEDYTSPDHRVTLVGSAQWDNNAIDAGGPAVQTMAAGDGFNFVLNWPGNYDHITVNYIDVGGSFTVAIDGGAPLATIGAGTSGNTLSQVIAIPAGNHTSVQVRQMGSASSYIPGVSFWSSTLHKVQVINAGMGGWTAASANQSFCNGNLATGSLCGFGLTAGVASLKPTLVLLDLCINDIIHGGSGSACADTEGQIAATLQSAGSEVILIIPGPFSDPTYATQMPALRAELHAVAVARGVGLIDLSQTYGNDYAALSSAGLMGSDALHPDATLYANEAARIAHVIMQGQAE